MAMSSSSYLDILPVEILHHIIDKLDVQTILFSFRYVCKRFHSIVELYDNYDLNFESISKSDFHLICRMISFDRVVSLTVSDKDKTHGQIQLFLSLFNINQFSRLRRLKLIQIEDDHLKVFLHYVVLSTLTSLSIDSQTFSIRNNTALNLLSSAIEHPTLEKLDLNMWPKDMIELQWPMSCTISNLRIRNSISVHQFYLILQYSQCLQTMSLKDLNIDDTDDNSSMYLIPTQFIQLRSLACAGGRIQMDKLEQCLSFTPALVHLKLIGNSNLFNSPFDGFRWEQLIEKKLPRLRKFEFFISVLTHVNFDTNNVMEIISSFRTPFWLSDKQWLVTCDYIVYLHKLMLFSMPICEHNFVYYSDMNKVSASNFSMDRNDVTMMDNVNELALHLSKVINTDDGTQRENRLCFRNVTELALGIDGGWIKGSLRFLSTKLDFLHLVKLFLSVNFSHEYMPSVVHGVTKLLQQAVNIHTLSLFDYWAPDNCTTSMETVRSMMTSNVKHLQIRVRSSDDIKFIIEHCEHLTSVTFEYAQNLIFSRGKFIDCLSDLNRRSSRWECQFALHVWLDHH